MSVYEDTIRISEVIISRKQAGEAPAGFKKASADSAVMKSFSLSSLAEALSANSSVFIKSYGAGGSATPSFRGTGASQTQVAWNGIKIDHPMLGQSDLSLLPLGMTDELNIWFGGASMSLNSGAAGGIISMNTRPDWKNQTSITLNPGAGSFGRYSGLALVRTGFENFHSVTRVFLQSVENNFSYMNRVSSAKPFQEIRKNSQMEQKGLMQELYYRTATGLFSARMWYQTASRNLPASMLTAPEGQGEKQDDESLRLLLNYDHDRGKHKYFVTGAWLMNRLNYFNRIASIDSRNSSDTWIIKAGMKGYIGQIANFSLVLNEELSTVRSNNYEGDALRNSADISVSAQTINTGRLNGSLVLREILYKNKFLLPDFASGIQFWLAESGEYFVRANISRTSRIPSLNELYWYPGGNTDLNNEYAFIYELGYEMSQAVSKSVIINYDITVYRNSIKDMIQWRPGEFSYWTAGNVRNVSTRGLETAVALTYSINNRVKGIFSAGYSYTRATDDNSDEEGTGHRQMIYVPENQANASLRIKYGKLYTSWSTNMTGRRYTPAVLPSYFVNCLSAGYQLNPSWGSLNMDFEIDNIFNTEYQTIAYYPLPGRSFGVKFLIQLIKLK